MTNASGPLSGLRVVEMAAIGPVPFACMLLANMGADIVRIERPGATLDPEDLTAQRRRYVSLDLKDASDVAAALDLIASADLLLEGFRPGVMERLGLGPEVVFSRNPALVFGRMTGWGQTGPLANVPGHDIDYIAITGALAAIGGVDRPSPPLNLIGDYGGGAMFLVMGALAALREAEATGQGQVVDAAMCEGALNLLTPFQAGLNTGRVTMAREANMLDGGAHYYNVYECADSKHIAIGAIEPQFYAELRKLAELDDPAFDAQHDQGSWPDLRARLAAVFRSRTRAEWAALLEGTDACVAPVLTLEEAPAHPHLVARGAFVDGPAGRQPAPAPRFSLHTSPPPAPPPSAPSDPAEILNGWNTR